MIESALITATEPAEKTSPRLDLTPLARRAGLIHPTSASAGLAARYGLSPTAGLVESYALYDLLWAVNLTLNGCLPARQQYTRTGLRWLVEFSSFVQGEVEQVQMVATLEATPEGKTLHLSLPEETPAPNLPRVLVVDDDVKLARLSETFLRRGGFDVTLVHTGGEALLAAQTAKPDLILLDVDLPDLSGLEVCRQLKGHPETARIPVVFCSGRYDALEEGLRLGAVDCLAKPPDFLHLAERLHRLLVQANPASAKEERHE